MAENCYFMAVVKPLMFLLLVALKEKEYGKGENVKSVAEYKKLKLGKIMPVC